MATVRISDKGQVTLPAAARRKLGIAPKSHVDIEVRENEIVIRPIKSVGELGGVFRERAKGKTTDWKTIRDRTEQVVAEEVAREGRE